MLLGTTQAYKTFCPYLRTEETICELLERDADEISDDYILMILPLAHMINSIGIAHTNGVISQMIMKDKQRVFVCQHVLVDKLDFSKTDIVFTPHSSVNDNFISIPHYSVNIAEPKEDKIDDFSFIGSTSTHWTRKKIVELYDNCLDSGQYWGLATTLGNDFTQKYINHTNDFKYSVCPRGTGISSIRLFESMAMGSTPIIIADGYELPLDGVINWDDYVIRVPENEVGNIDKYLTEKKTIKDVYDKYLSNDKLHEIIKITLNK